MHSLTPERRVVVVLVGITYRARPSAADRLRSTLIGMRAEGFEVELYIRGTWKGHGRSPHRRIPETLCQAWRQVGKNVRVRVEGSRLLWAPCYNDSPPPELVVRGVRSRHVITHTSVDLCGMGR